jgi:hypothetical protein
VTRPDGWRESCLPDTGYPPRPMNLIDDNYKFSVLILVITGLLLGAAAIGSLRAVRAYLGARRRRSDEPAEDSAAFDTADSNGPASEHSESWTSIALRAGVALLAVAACAAYVLQRLSEDYGDQEPSQALKLRTLIVTVSFMSALVPALRPRLSSWLLGSLLGLLTAAALAVITMFSIGAVDSMAAGVIVLAITAAPIACGAATIALAAAFAVKVAPVLGDFVPRSALRLVLVGAIVAGLAYLGSVWYNQPPTPDSSFRLQPSTWRGEMMYGYRAYPFKLVIEEVDTTGQFVGYMDWDPQYRLKIEGKASANHLVFEDTEFIRGQAQTGIFDRKDVWIANGEMSGTDKNGRARLTATLVKEPLEVAPAPGHGAAATTASAVKAGPDVDPGVIARTETLCSEMSGLHEDAYASACWSNLALLSARQAYCGLIADERARLECLESFASVHGDLTACKALGPDRFEQCAYAVAAAVQNDGLCTSTFPNGSEPQRALCRAAASGQQSRCQSDLHEAALRLTCDHAMESAARARRAFQALGQRAFFEAPSLASVSACDPSQPQIAQTQSLCRLDQLRRGLGAQDCSELTDPAMQSICDKIRPSVAR